MDEEDVQRLDSLKSRDSRLFLQGNEGACQRLDNLRGTISVPLTNPNEGACTYISERGLRRPSGGISTRDTLAWTTQPSLRPRSSAVSVAHGQ